MARCASCGAEIVWAIMDSSRRMPVDAKPEKRVVLEGLADDTRGAVRNTYTSHFQTCPNADKHRKAPSK